ncbi:MAG: hypothetical protein D3906_15620 [Candidatus Electrothrix sp. AUS1_2]|nr:hypothetical protein [Candidatus Electrothrix sp. AUS1_2]
MPVSADEPEERLRNSQRGGAGDWRLISTAPPYILLLSLLQFPPYSVIVLLFFIHYLSRPNKNNPCCQPIIIHEAAVTASDPVRVGE